MQDKETMQEQTNEKPQESRPNEVSGIQVEGHVKIFDPNSGEVFINKRDS